MCPGIPRIHKGFRDNVWLQVVRTAHWHGLSISRATGLAQVHSGRSGSPKEPGSETDLHSAIFFGPPPTARNQRRPYHGSGWALNVDKEQTVYPYRFLGICRSQAAEA